MRLLIIPVGTSPVHVLRVVLSLPKDRYEKIILRVTSTTSEYGRRILEFVSTEGYEANVVESVDLESYLGSFGRDWEFDLALGPGRKEDAMSILRATIGAIGVMPKFWIDFREKTGKGNAKQGEYFRKLRNSTDVVDEVYLIPEISMEVACTIYDVDPKIFDESWLEWDSKSCKVILKAEDPDRPSKILDSIDEGKKSARIADKKIARDWESVWLERAGRVREMFGLHAVIASHSPLPKKPRHWMSTGARMKHHNFKGGHK